MTADKLPPNWLLETLERCKRSVDAWPEWKKIAYRVIPHPERDAVVAESVRTE